MTTGWALVELDDAGPPRLVQSGRVKVTGPLDPWGWLARQPFGETEPLVALEDSYLAGHGNVKTLKCLVETAAWWRAALVIRGLEVESVMADRWQRALLTGLIGPRSNREARKRAAQAWCRARFGVELPQDEADAACMAAWLALERRARGARDAGGTTSRVPGSKSLSAARHRSNARRAAR